VKQDTLKALSDGLATSTVSLGIGTSSLSWLGFLNDNAAGLGVLLTFASFVIYFVFQILSHRKLSLADQNKLHLERIEKESKKELKLIKAQMTDNIDRVVKELKQLNKSN
jgi:hypothetical protein